jgi:phospholipase C
LCRKYWSWLGQGNARGRFIWSARGRLACRFPQRHRPAARARRHPHDGKQVLRPLPQLAARCGRAARHDLPGDRRELLPELPARARLPGLYFCSFAGETFPNRFYQHAAQTDRDHNSDTLSSLATIWDQLSPVPNTQGVPTGGYFFRDLPFLALWGTKYFPFWHPLADIRLGERFIADAYHALANAGYLDNTVFVVTFDEWGGFFEHVPPPHVIDDTNPADVDHTGDSTTPTDGQLIPDYTQLGFRVPAIVVSNLARPRVVHHGPFEHTSTLKLIETTFGLQTMTARDAHALNLGLVLGDHPRPGVPAGAIPTSSQVPGPANDAAAVCSATSVQSVSPPPARFGENPGGQPYVAGGWPTGSGMAGLGDQIRKNLGA